MPTLLLLSSAVALGAVFWARRLRAEVERRRKAEEALRESEAFLSGVFDATQDGICVLSPDMIVLRVNRTMERMFGGRGDLVGRKCHEVFHGLPDPCEICPSREAIATKQLSSAVVHRTDPGSGWIEIFSHPAVDERGRVRHVVEYVHDVTEKLKAEEHRQDVERMLRHDLKSPLIGMQALAHIFAASDNLTPKQHQLVQSLADSSSRMLRFLDMSRALYMMEAGDYEPETGPVDLVALTDAAVVENRHLCDTMSLSVRIVVDGSEDEDATFVVSGEELLCSMVLSNLIRNAVEASPKWGQVTISMHDRTVEINNAGVVPPEVRDRFFEKYATHGKRYGTGLGTYMARLAAETLGWKISMQTSAADGTTLRLDLNDDRNA